MAWGNGGARIKAPIRKQVAGVAPNFAKIPAVLLSALIAASCMAQPPDSIIDIELADWASPRHGDHALVGRIWDSRLQSFVTSAELLDGLRGARFLLLGEKHDNADHHRLRLAVLESLITADALAGVAFEMIDASRAPKLAGIANREFATEDELRAWLEWDDGWEWEFYSPLLRSSLAAGLPLAAANIAEDAVMDIYQGTGPVLPEGVFDQAAMDKLYADIDESHCGLLPESQFPAMVRVQQARDLAMAEALRSLADENGAALLFAGNYHARQDLGVPNFLLSLDAEISRGEIVSLAFLEVEADELVPVSYLERFGGIAEHDYLWFTPAMEERDYCAQLR